mgnify:CR=1 FL=1
MGRYLVTSLVAALGATACASAPQPSNAEIADACLLLKENMPITRVLSLTYVTIKFIIREYRPNELYCSQWLNQFLDHSLKMKGRREMMAEQTLIELIDNNQRILTKRISKSTVNKFIQLVS